MKQQQVISPTPEQLRRQAEDMLKRAEQMEKTGATKDALKKSLIPALRDLMQAKHRAQLAVDELIDCMAELEGRMSQFEKILQEVLA